MTEVKEGADPPAVCPPHSWDVKEKEKGDGPEEGARKKRAEADNFAERDQKRAEKAASFGGPPAKPKFAEEVRSNNFEAKAIEKNHEKKPIAATEVMYFCTICRTEIKVDIVFEDGQVAESQSETSENYRKEMLPGKRKDVQSAKLRDLQRQKNEEKGTSHSPMAKFDASQVGDADSARKTAASHGMVPEFIP
jgi:hypothetical protein